MAFNKDKALERAERYAAKGQHDKAAREYQSVVDHDAKDIRAWLMLADCLVRCSDKLGAIERYLRVAAFYADGHQPQKALAVYRQVLNLDPARLDVHLKVGTLNLELGRAQDAIASFELVAHAQMQAGQAAEAINTYRLVADADPTAVSKRLRLAELYSREGRNAEAVESFRLAGMRLIEIGRTKDYIRVAERLIYHANDDQQTLRTLARVYLELGEPRRALMKLNALLQGNSADNEGLELLAETFVALDKPDKAVSVFSELARELRKQGPEAHHEAVRVLRRGLELDPSNAELRSGLEEMGALSGLDLATQEPPGADLVAQAAPEPRPGVGPSTGFEEEPEEEIEELDLDDSSVVEIDDDDIVLEEDAEREIAAGPAMTHRTEGSSLTATVMSEVDGGGAAGEGDDLTDFDKILYEARVYVKYRLFEHALDHLQQALDRQPDHVGALSLRARALGELGRVDEAADTHLTVARQVFHRDPKLAREHVQAAIKAVPEHMQAAALLADLDAGDQVAASPTDIALDVDTDALSIDEALRASADGDSEAIELSEEPPTDVLADALSRAGESELVEPAALRAVDDQEFAIEFQESEAEELETTQPIAVENRFGLSGEHPLPGPEPTSPDLGVPDPSVSDAEVGSAPRLPAEAPSHYDVLDLDDDVSEPPPAADQYAEPEFDAGLPEPTVHLDDVGGAEQPEQPPVDSAPDGGWPDISDDLAEIRFYRDQGLDDDAEAAMADLRGRFPGHPDLTVEAAEVAVEETAAAAAAAVGEGATPLVLIDEDDEEADAYLSAIFSDQASAPKKKEVVMHARAEVEGAGARDFFDLGMAYREMGLVDDAIGQFEAASQDPHWRAKALVMMAGLRVHRGETDQALAFLTEAIGVATNTDELDEAKYELGLLYEKVGNTTAAIEQLQAVAEGFRDRDEKLHELLAG